MQLDYFRDCVEESAMLYSMLWLFHQLKLNWKSLSQLFLDSAEFFWNNFHQPDSPLSRTALRLSLDLNHGGRIIDNLQIDNLQIDIRQIDNQNLQIDNQHITFFRAFSDMNSTMADLLYSIMFSQASYSGILL